MTHDAAKAEARRRQSVDADVTWIVTQIAGEWTVARIGIAPRSRQTVTATHPPPIAPRDELDRFVPIARQGW